MGQCRECLIGTAWLLCWWTVTVPFFGLGIYMVCTSRTTYEGFPAIIAQRYTPGQNMKIGQYPETQCAAYLCAIVNFTNTVNYTGQCYWTIEKQPKNPIVNYRVTLYREGWYTADGQPVCAVDESTKRSGRFNGGTLLIIFMGILAFVAPGMLAAANGGNVPRGQNTNTSSQRKKKTDKLLNNQYGTCDPEEGQRDKHNEHNEHDERDEHDTSYEGYNSTV